MRRPKFKRLREMVQGATDAVFLHVTGHVHKGQTTSFAALSVTERDEGGLIIEVDRFEGEVELRGPGGVVIRLLPTLPREGMRRG